MLWVGRLFEERLTALRLSIVSLTGVAYLAMVPEARTQSGLEWILAVGALVFGFVGIWSPLAVVGGISAGLGVGHLLGVENDAVPAVALAWAMFELGARRFGWQVWCGLIVGIAGTMLSDYAGVREVALTVIYRLAAGVAGPLLLGLHVRTLGELNRQAADRAQQEAARVRAEERTTIARELHDLVAHHVASIVLRVAVARNVLPLDDPRVRQVLDDVHATGSGALADLRRLVAVLRDPGSAQPSPVVDPTSLPVALASVVERSQQLGLTVQADIDPEISQVDARTALAMLRLTQEGLANVAKHAGTNAKAQLSIRLSEDRVEFDLRDFGGAAAAAAGHHNSGHHNGAHHNGGHHSGGHGLIGLRERVEVLGGSLQAGATGSGWRVTALVPTGAAT